MARIAFLPIPTPGHINPTFKLAKVLRARGHEVIYSSLRDVEDPILAEGFAFEPAFEEQCPKGMMPQVAAKLAELRGPRLFFYAREVIRWNNLLMHEMTHGGIERQLSRLRPDLILVDEMLLHARIIAYGSRIPTLVLNTTIPEMEPGPRPSGILNTLRHGLRKSYREAINHLLHLLGLDSPIPTGRAIDELSRKYDYPLPPDPDGIIRLSNPRIPELVLSPREFIETGTTRTAGQCHYLGPCLDLERQEPDFPWERLAEGKPLVFLSLGTLSFGAPESRAFFELCLRTAALRPDWQFVLATGSVIPTSLGTPPPNLLAVQQAPQLRLLQRAAAMVTHCGFNSAKECIYFGVPMVAIPQRADQPQVAHLVAHHGLGVRSSLPELTPQKLLALLDEVTTRPALRGTLEAMRARFRETNSDDHIASTLERFLPTTPARALAD
ncbi:glycosyltransferase family 1 protein [Archangium violaceum]|uniref:glycosyltransferase n=1 Tax=Archangium violaceum TaxID=83451 RepID=UPI0019508B57|nr:glycosyltransferase [Archangium violaceum]QRN95170.1 glycosyltransferase family 1 protein [Archangium violaceum]